MNFAKVAVPAPLLPLDSVLDYRIPDHLKGQVQAGSFVEVPFGRRKTWGLVFLLSESSAHPPEKVKEIERLILPDPIFDKSKLEFFFWLSRYYFFPIGEVCEAAIPGPVRDGTERTLKLKETEAAKDSGNVLRMPRTLNEAQKNAVNNILSSPPRPHLLWGVTGSGKTEVYLESIAETIKLDRGAIVLVPEISLTPQLTRRFEERFPGNVAVFHSGQKPTELRKAWLETFYGKKQIAVGARSAIFAPVRNPGIIVIDEEHDGSYKQEERLRYHARDCAIYLGNAYQIPVVLGSATPSSEVMHLVRSGKVSESQLPERAVGEALLPQIHIVDLKKSISQQNLSTRPAEGDVGFDMPDLPSVRGEFFLSPELRNALEETLANKKQAILFLNRRGVGSQVICQGCGYIFECPSCDVKLTPHRHKLVCHYCAFERTLPSTCPKCKFNKDPFVQVGVGTAAIEDAVKLHFPAARVLRLDRDTTESRGSLESIVEDFAQRNADVLIGTQMVAKGHDFPDVTLVGILLGEMGLAVPDFRAFERSFQLLLQVSGRAGRSTHAGRVFLQTFQPEHPVFQALEHFKGLPDYGTFVLAEIQKRIMLNYPPVGRLILLKFDGLDAGQVSSAATDVANALKQINPELIQVLGPVASPIAKLRSRYRYQLLLKSPSIPTLQKAINWIFDGWERNKMEKTYRTRMLVDVDPVQMM